MEIVCSCETPAKFYEIRRHRIKKVVTFDSFGEFWYGLFTPCQTEYNDSIQTALSG
jgi:hypothetical protein